MSGGTAVQRRDAGSAVAALRRATSSHHRSIEDAVDVMSPRLDRGCYADVLVRFARVHRATDRVLANWFGPVSAAPVVSGLDIARRAKCPPLLRDLARLGVTVPPGVLWDVGSRAEAVGVLYVCEGSTLGGLVVADHVRSVLGPGTPVEFFASYGAEVIEMWSRCRAAINAMIETNDDMEAAVHGAVATFRLVAAEMRR